MIYKFFQYKYDFYEDIFYLNPIFVLKCCTFLFIISDLYFFCAQEPKEDQV